MPEPYYPKRQPYPLSALVEQRSLVRVTCRYCKRSHVYYPDDLIHVFGDVDVDSLMGRMKCEADRGHGALDVKAFVPSGQEAVGLRIRRLKFMRTRLEPVWTD